MKLTKPGMEFLYLEEIESTPWLAGMLPGDVERRYHVLPVGIEQGRITLAAADPTNELMCQNVHQLLGQKVCFVQADLNRIDTEIKKIRNSQKPQAVYWGSFRSWNSDEETAPELYLECLGTEPRGPIKSPRNFSELKILIEKIQARGPDLFLFGIPDFDLQQSFFSTWVHEYLLDMIPCSMLYGEVLHLPIKKILFVGQGNNGDCLALPWCVQIGLHNRAEIILLMLLPPVPFCCSQLVERHINPGLLLNSGTAIGKRTRRLLEQISQNGLNGKLLVSNYSLPEQIILGARQEQADLIIIGRQTQAKWKQWLFFDVVPQVASRTSLPVLVAKPRKG